MHEFSTVSCQWIEVISCWGSCNFISLLLSILINNEIENSFHHSKTSFNTKSIRNAHSPFNDCYSENWTLVTFEIEQKFKLTSLSRSLELSASLGATDDVVRRSDARPLSSDVPGSFANDVIEFWKEKKIQKKSHEWTAADNNGFSEWKKKIRFDSQNCNGYPKVRKGILVTIT